jgi:hypothetical protein
MDLELSYTWVNWLHVLFVGPLLLWVGTAGKATPAGVFTLLMVIGAVVVLYHFYKLILAYKKEGFLRANNYYWMHNPDAKEPFVPFSHPYTCESSAYYSYHDPTNSRACPCDLNGGEGKCAAQNVPQDTTDMVSSKPGTPTGVPAAAPAKPASGALFILIMECAQLHLLWEETRHLGITCCKLC